MEEDIDITVKSPPSDSFMGLEVGMSDHSNDAASLCPPQRVYIPQRPSQWASATTLVDLSGQGEAKA